jgi:tRNA-uridine 2-sulfurtransferase
MTRRNIDFLQTRHDVNAGARVAVGLSGGVDSAVAALLLKQAGFSVTGVHMQCWDYTAEGCKGNEDRSDAIAVCSNLDIEFKFLNFEQEYKAKVIDLFYADYKNGLTPNPDVLCNKEIKFGLFLEWALQNGFDYVATGHYAQIIYNDDTKDGDDGDRYSLLRGVDVGKDQSYFLYLQTQETLAKTLFPLGGLRKEEVRSLATDAKLPVAKKAESMGICFVGEVDIRDFLKKRIPSKIGDVVLKSTGEIVGKHEGAWFFTVGQRHGFDVDKYVGLPLYVLEKDISTNVLYVGFHEDAMSSTFAVNSVHWVGENPLAMSNELNCLVRIRHLGDLFEGAVSKTLNVNLKEKAFGVAPGQIAVFYADDKVLGGGVIS